MNFQFVAKKLQLTEFVMKMVEMNLKTKHLNKVLRCNSSSRAYLIVIRAAFVFILCAGLSSCAYKLSNSVDALPGNAKSLFIPVFKNASVEPGIEVFFTNALKRESLTSKSLVLLNDESSADAVLYGVVRSIDVQSDESVIEAKDTKYLPRGTVLSTQMKVTVQVTLTLKRKNSSEILWTSDFKQSRNYTPPQVTLPVINSSNNLYNLSARRQTLETLASEMMQLAFDRMVDNF